MDILEKLLAFTKENAALCSNSRKSLQNLFYRQLLNFGSSSVAIRSLTRFFFELTDKVLGALISARACDSAYL